MPFLGTTGGGSVKQYGGQANLGYFIKNSLRFRAANTSNLSRSHSASDRQKWTFSFWVKRGRLNTDRIIGVSGTGSEGYIGFVGDAIYAIDFDGTTTYWNLFTNAVFRDPAAWYHIVLALDTTQATSSNRVKLYVNGSLMTSFQAEAYPTQNYQGYYNSAVTTYIGRRGYDTNDTLDGYLAEFNFIDGQQLTPSSFGKTDAITGQWIPKKFGGSSYGTNGFYLKFADASAATAAAIGKDYSSNGNNWTPNNISVTAGATYDAMIDSPSLSAFASNYPTLNPLDMGTPAEPMSAGNLNINGGNNIRATMACPSTGKWYFEYTRTNTTDYAHVGIFATSLAITSLAAGSQIYRNDGGIYENGTNPTSGASYTTNDVIGVAVNCDASELSWYKNNTLVVTRSFVAQMTTSNAIFGVRNNAGATGSVNFGQRPFTYTPPSGFKSLNTFNLP